MVSRWRAVFVSALVGAMFARGAGAQTRRVTIDRVPTGAGHEIQIAASDSNTVTVTVAGGKHPLVSQGSAESARRWSTRADSISRTVPAAIGTKRTLASERDEFGHFSDILRFQRLDSAPAPRNVIAIDIGPRNLPVYEVAVSPTMLERLTTTMRRAAARTDSLTPPSKRCYLQRDMEPMDYSGPNAYAAGTDLNTQMQPSLSSGSPVPAYPESALGARVTGRVVARFVIDTAGHPIIETFRLRTTANPMFVQAVCDALPRMQFVPSRRNGRSVTQLVEESFTVAPPTSTR